MSQIFNMSLFFSFAFYLCDNSLIYTSQENKKGKNVNVAQKLAEIAESAQYSYTSNNRQYT